jgi:ElaB/YqjD/DUF883 family membrane-anchored ribosome-binding protein
METWVPIFVGITALAFVLQAIALLGIFLQIRRTAKHAEEMASELRSRLNPILARLQVSLEDLTPRLTSIASDAAEVSRLARSQAQKVDRIITETMEILRTQLIHLDQVLTGAVEKVEEAGSRLREAVWGPVAKASALIKGIQTGISVLRSSRRRKPRNVSAEDHEDIPNERMVI